MDKILKNVIDIFYIAIARIILSKIKHIFFTSMVIGLTFAFSASVHSEESGWVAQGRRIPWTMRIPGFWIGGNIHQIHAMQNQFDSKFWQNLIELLKKEAEYKDAVFYHYQDILDINKIPCRCLSKIFVQIVPMTGEMAKNWDQTGSVEAIAKLYRDILQSELAPGETVSLNEIRTLMVDGKSAVLFVYKIKMNNGKLIYKAYIYVKYQKDYVHLFYFETGQSRYKKRFDEFLKMVDSLNYK